MEATGVYWKPIWFVLEEAFRTDPGECRTCEERTDQVTFRNIANEQVEAVGNLIQVAVLQGVGRQRAGDDVVGLGAQCRSFSRIGRHENANTSAAWGRLVVC